FHESGKPVLKLIGDVKPVSVIIGKEGEKSSAGTSIQITDDPNAPVVRIKEENILKEYPLDYLTLVKNLRLRYNNFKMNAEFHKLKKEFKKDKKLCRKRYLNPNNPKTSSQDFYNLAIYKKFDQYYIKK
ncbi:MAG: hypothetical protein ABID67_01320, partial [Candidatus Nealsonbacteria bacterium]